ncbi:AAA family ATPase [Azospirillum halopraeferens]|uniref:cytidylate kinase-like family protein n=1 Tax=Azospirillum halopraeferens TaxID=34010 RepID=UPI000424CCC6|nr:cytidylate kinase-like family protein [Azospirillum halopraeferens]
MTRETLRSFLAFLAADDYQSSRPDRPPPPVVTIARDHGAGGEEVARRVAEALGVPCYDRELIDGVVAEARSDKALMRTLDEKVPARGGAFLFASLLGLSDPLPEYEQTLTRVVKGIARHGGVIVGRGAHLLLYGVPCLRVRIVGSEEACARRLAGGDSGAIPARLEEVRTINHQRAAFHTELFKVSNNDPLQYDLVINTDHFVPLDGVADLIVRAFRARMAADAQRATG